jgi:hypothetical protein
MNIRYVCCSVMLATMCSTTALAAERFNPAAECTDEMRGPYPFNYSQLVKDYISSSFKDPSSVIDLDVYKPAPGFWSNALFKKTRENTTCNWYIAFSANGKNSYGAYVGSSVRGLWVRYGEITNSMERTGVDPAVISEGEAAYERNLKRLSEGERDALVERNATNSMPVPKISYIDELRELAKLRDDGVISNSEFDARKKKILASGDSGAP